MKIKFLNQTVLILVLVFISIFSSIAQINTPRPSPSASIMQKIGLADVTIAYSRPSAKGRKIFGDVVPFNKIWRTGANEPTKLTTTDTISIGGKKIGPGEYGLYTIPGESEWTVIFGKNPKTSAGAYKEEEDAVRLKVRPETSSSKLETFTIDFANVTTTSADLVLSWENTSVKFKIENEVDKKVMAQIKDRNEDINFQWQAASYYFDNNKDLNQAYTWVNKVVERNPQFWTWHLKAKIEAKQNKCALATASAQKSMELAKTAGNDEYVKFNEKLIADCKGKK
ncbi:MAG TPA: DUF2911 domain-containing protein [Cytophagaceae bacterium]|jgi:hypothetical protein